MLQRNQASEARSLWKDIMLIVNAALFLSTIAIFLISLTVHEYAHARVAYYYGDDTAARMGRLTLNPLAHISLFGTILLPLIAHFGWAKPVPVNFGVLTRNQIFKVAVAGPLANLGLAVGLAALFHLFHLRAAPVVAHFVLLAILSNILLAVFNLIPIPPLDGSKMVYAKLRSREAIAAYGTFSQFGMFVLIAFLIFGGLRVFVYPVVGLVYTLLGLPFSSLLTLA
jgi:Zn-dependent protease